MAGNVPVLSRDDYRDQGAMTADTVNEDEVLDALENEAIATLRETAAAFKKPVLTYCISTDSSVLLHVSRKLSARLVSPTHVCTWIVSGSLPKSSLTETGWLARLFSN